MHGMECAQLKKTKKERRREGRLGYSVFAYPNAGQQQLSKEGRPSTHDS